MTGIGNMGRWIRRESIHMFHAVNPVSRTKRLQWKNSDGVDFLRTIGVKAGNVVIDFGCGPGNFCIPAARLIGAGGRVYAIDKNTRVLKTVRRQAKALGLQNLRAVSSLAELTPLPGARHCNVVLLYDMLHFLDAPERRQLYAALYGMLMPGGLLSVHMKHVKDNNPGHYFAAMSAGDVAREIEASGFGLGQRLPVRIWHAHDTENSSVWNFIKR